MRELKVLTWNIWFDKSTMEQRLPHILDTVWALNPDIIAMQEVTNTALIFLNQHLGSLGFMNTESDSDIRKRRGKGTGFSHGYGTVIFTKHEFVEVKYGRILVRADIQLTSSPTASPVSPSSISTHKSSLPVPLPTSNNPSIPTIPAPATNNQPPTNDLITIFSGHLDSLGHSDNVHHRQIQINDICNRMKQLTSGSALFVGDTNLMFDEEELTLEAHTSGEPAIVDVWNCLREGEAGFTYDYTLNKQIKDTYRTRLDRVFAKSTNSWIFKQISMVGTTPFKGLRDSEMWPSDHFGLLCIFSKQQ